MQVFWRQVPPLLLDILKWETDKDRFNSGQSNLIDIPYLPYKAYGLQSMTFWQAKFSNTPAKAYPCEDLLHGTCLIDHLFDC